MPKYRRLENENKTENDNIGKKLKTKLRVKRSMTTYVRNGKQIESQEKYDN
jgi:hypothetical protein